MALNSIRFGTRDRIHLVGLVVRAPSQQGNKGRYSSIEALMKLKEALEALDAVEE